MNTLLEDPVFVFMWIGFLVLMSVGTGAVFLWAIRAGQFSGQDRARYLALEESVPVPVEPAQEQRTLGQPPPLPQPKPLAAGQRARGADEGVTLATALHEGRKGPGDRP